jgi:DNA-binding LacI/PurR family transcriptional regulator
LLKHRTVAMLWTGAKESQLTHTGQSMMRGIVETLREAGASLTVDYASPKDFIPPILQSGNLDGILIHGPEPSASLYETIQKLPIVWLLQAGGADFGDRVQPDHFFAGEISSDYLIRQGCRNLCCMSYCTVTEHFPYWKSRADSFMSHAELSGVPCHLLETPPEPGRLLKPSALSAAAEELVDAFMKLKSKPDGLFIANNLGYPVHHELIRRGIRPMKDLLIIAGDSHDFMQELTPDPIKIEIHAHEIGRLAVEALMLRIRQPDSPQFTISIKPSLDIPETTPAAG